MVDKDLTESAGYWWLENSPDNKVAGVLRLISEGKYSLKTIGSLSANGLEEDASSIDVTLFGDCQGTLYTIPRASLWHITDHSVGEGSKGSVETWESFLMIRGTHLGANEAISSMTFGLSGLSALWDRWGSNTEPDERMEKGGPVELEDKSRVVLYRARSSQSGLGRRSYQDHVRIQVTSPSALLLEEFGERFVYPLQILVSAITGKPSETLDQHGILPSESDEPGSGIPRVFDINPWKSVDDETRSSYGSLLLESDSFFPELVSTWLTLADKLIRAMAISAPRTTRGFVESETLAAVSAAEQIQREIIPPMPTPFATSVSGKLAEHAKAIGLNSKERRKVVNVLRQMEFSLEQRLVSLTQCDDDGLFDWFLHGHIAQWAKVTAYVRNQLGHGLPELEGTTARFELMVEVGEAMRNVTTLRLLIACGYPPDLLRQRLQGARYWSGHQEKGQQWPRLLHLIESKK